jgi:hypothetical protein
MAADLNKAVASEVSRPGNPAGFLVCVGWGKAGRKTEQTKDRDTHFSLPQSVQKDRDTHFLHRNQRIRSFPIFAGRSRSMNMGCRKPSPTRHPPGWAMFRLVMPHPSFSASRMPFSHCCPIRSAMAIRSCAEPAARCQPLPNAATRVAQRVSS